MTPLSLHTYRHTKESLGSQGSYFNEVVLLDTASNDRLRRRAASTSKRAFLPGVEKALSEAEVFTLSRRQFGGLLKRKT